MLDPKKSALVLMDAPIQQKRRIPEPMKSAIRRIIDVAELSGIPVVLSVYPGTSTVGMMSMSMAGSISTDYVPFDPTPVDWPRSPVGAAIAATDRRQVVIAGLWLEEAITFLTLNCLWFGLDAYVPVDATLPLGPSGETAARARLTQAGAVPTSVEQIVREWAALHACKDVAAAMRSLLSAD